MPTFFNKKSKNNGEKIRTKKELGLTSALITLIIMITSMLLTVAVLEKEPHIPLMIGTAVAIIITMLHGYAFSEVEEMMYKGIRHALPAIVIIILVGLVIGSWIGSGVVATMIYYGLQLIDPRYFLVVVIVLCGIVALAIGSSWSTMATVGVASMGIGLSMGISPGLTNKIIGFTALLVVLIGAYMTVWSEKSEQQYSKKLRNAVILLLIGEIGYWAYSAAPQATNISGMEAFLPQAMGMVLAAVI